MYLSDRGTSGLLTCTDYELQILRNLLPRDLNHFRTLPFVQINSFTGGADGYVTSDSSRIPFAKIVTKTVLIKLFS